MVAVASLTGWAGTRTPSSQSVPASAPGLSRPIDLVSRDYDRYDHPPPTLAPRAGAVDVARPQRVEPAPAPPRGGGSWGALANCESGGHNDDTGNGFYGYFQFDAGTWRSVSGLAGVASDYSYDVQLAAAEKLYAERGRAPWPICGRYL